LELFSAGGNEDGVQGVRKKCFISCSRFNSFNSFSCFIGFRCRLKQLERFEQFEQKFYVSYTMTTLIIGATELELSWLAGHLQAQQDGLLMGCPVYRADNILLITSGPGMANAAAACAAAIERYSCTHIYNTGICGVYSHDRSWLGKAVIGARALFADTGAALNNAFQSLEEMRLPLACLAGKKIYNSIELSGDATPNDIPRADFLTVAAVSGSPEIADKLSLRCPAHPGRLLCEDMESAAVGLIALRAGIPCTVVRGISNRCGSRDHRRWKIRKAAQAAQETLHAILQNNEQTS
jgi:futalosine hydrolase